MAGKVVCVTGASGYIASWLVKVLLRRGYTVNATVRNLSDPSKVEHLKGFEGAEERLQLFEANLMEEGSFDSAINDCDGVFHTASPVILDHVNDPQVELIQPAVNGTVNVLRSCAKVKSVKRVVLTSSMATVLLRRNTQTAETVADESWFFDPLLAEENQQWYVLSKILAEEAAKRFAEENGIDMVIINPSLVTGPLLQPTLNETSHCFLTLISQEILKHSNINPRRKRIFSSRKGGFAICAADFEETMAKRRALIDVEEGRTKAKHDRPQRPPILQDEGSDDDFMDTPRTRSVVHATNTNMEEAMTKAKHDRPQNRKKSNDQSKTALIGNKRNAKEIIVNEGQISKKKTKGNKLPAKASYPKLSTRTSPYSLVKAFQEMNKSQKNAVINLGFGHIMKLLITDIPSRLAYWVVDNFDARSCQLILGTGDRITVDYLDVHRVFGFPMGGVTIDIPEKTPKCDLLVEWTGMFGSGKPSIGQKDIVKKMLEDLEGGEWFKRHFVILLVSSLIENTSHGYVTPNIMAYLDDVSKIKDMDWCKYTLECLLKYKKKWDKEKHKTFLGPALFLILFFVDIVCLYEKKNERSFPIFTNWTNDTLRARERDEISAKDFGCGRTLHRIDVGHDDVPKPNISDEEVDTGANEGDQTSEENYARKLYFHAKLVAEKMFELMEMIEKAPVSNSEYLHKAMRTSQKLCTGGKVQIGETSTDQTQFDSTQADRFWLKEDVLKIIEEVEAANPVKDKGVSKSVDTSNRAATSFPNWTDDIPSFSLGLTQDELRSEEQVHEDQGNEDRDLNRQTFEEKGKEKPDTEKEKGKEKVNRLKKKTAEFFSPYLNRKVKPTGRLTKLEKEVAYYMMHHSGKNVVDVVFKYGDIQLRLGELKSLRPTLYVLAEVVSTWSIILNDKEKLRAPDSRFRFFATVTATMNPITLADKTWDNARCEEWFCKNLTHELGIGGAKDIGQIDMFIFPVYKTNHFYVVCLDMRKSVMKVIDNANAELKNCLSMTKYRTTAIRIKSMFALFLEKMGMKEMALKVKGFEDKILHLKWVDPQNSIDCAIYTMQHMETYMGADGQSWQHGLNLKLTKQMRQLRARYCVEIATASCNEMREENITDAASRCSVLQKDFDLEAEVIDWEFKKMAS